MTTKTGKPCRAAPLKDSDFCLAHSDAKIRESAGFIAANGKAGRKPNPRAVDVLRDRIEANIDRVIQPLWDALEAEAGVALNVKGGGMELAMIPDHLTRLRAVRELLDRGYGRPMQANEITIVTQDLIDMEIQKLEDQLARNDSDRGERRVDPALSRTSGEAS